MCNTIDGQKTINSGSPPLLPNVEDIAAFTRPDDLQGQMKLLELTAAKVGPIYEKIVSDTHNRIVDTIMLLRGCRLLNFSFVIPMANLIFEGRAFYVQGSRDGSFSLLKLIGVLGKYCLRLLVWYKVASEGALVVVTSATVEHFFSMLASQTHDGRSRALSDYQTAAVLLRYDNNSRS